MAGMNFDVEGARAAGFSDADIANKLASTAGFDVDGARKAGFQDSDIIQKIVAGGPVAQPELAPEDVPGVGETLLIGAGRTFDRIGKGVQQVYYGATGDEEAAAKLKEEATADDEAYGMLQRARPIATGIGESLPSMAVPIGATASVPATLGKLALAGGAPELLKYGSAGERVGNAAGSAASAAAGGYLIPKAGAAVKKAGGSVLRNLAGDVSPDAAVLYRKAQALGIPVNAAQLSDSRFMKTLASTLEQMPFTGAAKTNAHQGEQYTRAITRTFGDDAPALTADVYRRNRIRLGTTFEALSSRNTLKVTPDLVSKLNAVADEAGMLANPDTEKSIRTLVSQYASRVQGGPTKPVLSSLVDPNGVPIILKPAGNTPLEMPGKAYQALDSKISQLRKAGGEKSVYLAKIQELTRDAMDQSVSPADKAAWDTAREQYKNLKLIRDVVARDGGSGIVPPMALMTALNRSEAGKEAMAKGVSGTVGDLAKIGKQFIRDPIPNSGTIQRGIAMGALGGGSIAFGIDPVTMGSLMVGSATTGRAMNKVLNSPKVAESIMRPRTTLQQMLAVPPSRISQSLGSGVGMTTEDQLEY